MIYIVSGFMRSGTSMMMRCLHAGGMSPVYDKRKDKQLEHLSSEDYQMNERFYELTAKDFFAKGFPLRFEGKVVKVLAPGLYRLPDYPYAVVFMLRHPVEIYASCIAAFEVKQNESLLSGDVVPCYPPSPLVYYQTVFSLVERQRKKGWRVATVGARSTAKWPLRTFCRLADRGWPIDPCAAAAAVDPARLRFRKESLAVRDREWESGRRVFRDYTTGLEQGRVKWLN